MGRGVREEERWMVGGGGGVEELLPDHHPGPHCPIGASALPFSKYPTTWFNEMIVRAQRACIQGSATDGERGRGSWIWGITAELDII